MMHLDDPTLLLYLLSQELSRVVIVLLYLCSDSLLLFSKVLEVELPNYGLLIIMLFLLNVPHASILHLPEEHVLHLTVALL